jgi:hypothetical protein
MTEDERKAADAKLWSPERHEEVRCEQVRIRNTRDLWKRSVFFFDNIWRGGK